MVPVPYDIIVVAHVHSHIHVLEVLEEFHAAFFLDLLVAS